MPGQILELQVELALRRFQLRARDDAAEIAVALGRLHQHRQRPRRGRPGRPLREFGIRSHRQLGADDGLEARLLRGTVELRRAVETVTVKERDRGITELRRAVDERRGERRGVEKGKRRGGVEFEVHGMKKSEGKSQKSEVSWK